MIKNFTDLKGELIHIYEYYRHLKFYKICNLIEKSIDSLDREDFNTFLNCIIKCVVIEEGSSHQEITNLIRRLK